MTVYQDQLNLCWKILPDVSRSFSLCIKKLPHPTDLHMMIGYLTLRILDTIEDSSASLETKEEAFKKFIGLLDTDSPSSKKVATCKAFLLTNIDCTYEHTLLENLGAVIDTYHSFEKDEKEAIIDCNKEMAGGMIKFQNQSITDFKLQEEYCYYVAGIVGLLDTRLFKIAGHISDSLSKELMTPAKHFGIALQKVNILRDVAYDIPEKRYFWPQDILNKYGLDYENLCDEKNRPQAMKVLEEVIDNALPYLEDAIDYTTRLPRSARKIRIFCLIPLFMAIKSYAKCIRNEDVFIVGKKVKIKKEEVQKIVQNSNLMASSNWALKRWYRDCMKDVKESLTQRTG